MRVLQLLAEPSNQQLPSCQSLDLGQRKVLGLIDELLLKELSEQIAPTFHQVQGQSV